MATRARTAIDFDRPSELLPRDLPPFAARAAAWTIILAVIGAVSVALFLPFPEDIEAPFVLAPKDPVDPLVAPIAGILESLDATEGRDVKSGQVLFVIAVDVAALEARAKSAKKELESLQSASGGGEAAAVRAAEAKVGSLSAELQFATARKSKTERLRKIAEDSFKQKLITEQALLKEQDADDEAGRALEGIKRAIADARSTAAELKSREEKDGAAAGADRAKLEAELREAESALAAVRDAGGGSESGGKRSFPVIAPRDGTITGIGSVRTGGAVRRGDVLCTVAPGDAELRAELSISELEAAKVEREQHVRLLFDAYPSVRYGGNDAVVSWISATAERGGYRAHAKLDEKTITVEGAAKPLRAGMSGHARVRVGNRRLVEYVF